MALSSYCVFLFACTLRFCIDYCILKNKDEQRGVSRGEILWKKSRRTLNLNKKWQLDCYNKSFLNIFETVPIVSTLVFLLVVLAIIKEDRKCQEENNWKEIFFWRQPSCICAYFWIVAHISSQYVGSNILSKKLWVMDTLPLPKKRKPRGLLT